MKKEIVIDGETYVLKEEVLKENTQFKIGEWVVADCSGTEGYTGLVVEFDLAKNSTILNPFIIPSGHYVDTKGTFDNVQRLATPKEIEAILIKEAKKRGYKKDALAIDLDNGNSGTISREGTYVLSSGKNKLFYGGITIYKDGKWAEIIKEEEIKIGDYKVEFLEGEIKVGCQRFSNEFIKNIASVSEICCDIGIGITLCTDGAIRVVHNIDRDGVVDYTLRDLDKIIDKLK